MSSKDGSSCTHLVDTERGLAYVKLYGDVEGAFIASCVRALRADPDWDDTFDVIWDERDIAVLNITPSGLDDMVDAQTSGQVGNDIVVSGRPSRDLILELYAMRTRAWGRPAKVFKTLDAALGFLGLSQLPTNLRLA